MPSKHVWSVGFSVLLLTTGCGVDRGDEPSKTPSKVSYIVEGVARSCVDTLAQGGDVSGLSNGKVLVKPTGEIDLAFHAIHPVEPAEEAQLGALGGVVSARLQVPPGFSLPPVGVVEAWIPCERVAEAANLPWVVAVTPPSYGKHNNHPTNPINSEGVALHNADTAQTQGITGAGVTVGVISNGVASLAAAQARNELPAVTVFNQGGGDEGTAMLEIVHDMAPGAALLYDDGTGTDAARDVRHANALMNLVANGADVISEDLRFDSQPAFQQGLVATAREAAAASGATVHSSSGNRGDDHAARVLATGTGAGPDGVTFDSPPPGCSFSPNNAVAIAPNGDTTFDVALGTSTSFTLQWSEPRAIFPTAGQGGFTDLDLYVMDAGLTQCLAESIGAQADGIGDTIEQIAINNPGTAVKIVVNVFSTSSAAATPRLDLRWSGTQSDTDVTTRAGSIDPDKNYTGLAFSIGAVNTGGNLVSFSSAGPVDLLLTTICPGGAAGPCEGTPGPAPQTFQGLDFLGANGVVVSGVGGFGAGTCPAVNPTDCRFFGTSAAAPHTAGCDALVRELLGATATRPLVRSRLASTALDFAPPGEDSTTGAGQVDCFQALGPPQPLCANVMVPTDPGVCQAAMASVDAGSFDPFDPDGSPSVSLSQSPAGPYPLGSTPVELTVTDTTNLSDSCTATVTVLDQEAPTINCPADVSVECTGNGGIEASDPALAAFFAGVSASDNCSANPTIGNDAPPLLLLGDNVVTFTATDAAGNPSQCSATITVVDTIPPVINVTLTPTELWPPNHNLVTINANVLVEDICDPTPGFVLTSITSNEPDNGTGDGNTSDDVQGANFGTADTEFQLRAERSGGGQERTYTVVYTAFDVGGNTTQAVVIVRVTHDQG